MTEPDEALIWARKRAREYTNPVYWDAIKNGHADHDWGIPEMTKGYRAGQAASAARIKALEDMLREIQRSYHLPAHDAQISALLKAADQ